MPYPMRERRESMKTAIKYVRVQCKVGTPASVRRIVFDVPIYHKQLYRFYQIYDLKIIKNALNSANEVTQLLVLVPIIQLFNTSQLELATDRFRTPLYLHFFSPQLAVSQRSTRTIKFQAYVRIYLLLIFCRSKVGYGKRKFIPFPIEEFLQFKPVI